MAGQFHGFGQGDAAIGGYGEIAGAQAVRRELFGIKPCHRDTPLDDCIDGTGLQCPRGNIASAIDFAKHAALGGFCLEVLCSKLSNDSYVDRRL